MKSVNEIRCPHCKQTFALADQLREEILGGLRLEMEKEIQKENEVFRKEEQKRLEQKYWDKYSKEKEKLETANTKQKEMLQQMQELEAKVTRDRLALEKLKQDYEKQKEEELQTARREAMLKARREVSEEYFLKEKEWSKKFSDQGILIEELKRKSEQGPIQLQGQVQEQAIEEALQQAFPGDRITRTVVGTKGGDILHMIYNRNGKACGSILFESKRTRTFSQDWLSKLKEDQRRINADLAILVTQAMPKGIESFGQMQGVWICSFHYYQNVAGLCREMIIRIYASRFAFEDADRKKELVYRYFTSAQFKQGVEMFIRLLEQQRQDMDKEKRTINGYWQKRSTRLNQLQDLVLETFGKIDGLTAHEDSNELLPPTAQLPGIN